MPKIFPVSGSSTGRMTSANHNQHGNTQVKFYDYSADQHRQHDITKFHQIPVAILVDIAERARYVLLREGYIQLGAFCAALQQENSRVKYGSLLFSCRPYFRRLSADGMWSLYERILFQLEREDGPLVCADRRSDERPTWGFADPVCDNCGAHATKPANALLTRSLVQIQGHPDWRYKKAGKMPKTVWKKSYTRTARAA